MLPEKQAATFLSGWAQTPQAQMQAMQTGGQLPQAQLPMTAMQQMQMPQQQQQRQPLQELIQAAAKPLSIPELLDVVSPRRDERGQEIRPDRLAALLQQLAEQQQQQQFVRGQLPQPQQQMMAQQPQMQQQAPISPAEIYAKGLETPQMRLQREIAEKKLEQQKELADIKRKTVRQESIEKANKPFNEMLSKEVPLAEKKKTISEEMLNLWRTGKVASGYTGLLPKIAQNQETQRFIELGQDLATILASQGAGAATNFKIKLAIDRKANPQQTPEAQLDNIVFMINEADKMLKVQEIRNKLIEQNDFVNY